MNIWLSFPLFFEFWTLAISLCFSLAPRLQKEINQRARSHPKLQRIKAKIKKMTRAKVIYQWWAHTCLPIKIRPSSASLIADKGKDGGKDKKDKDKDKGSEYCFELLWARRIDGRELQSFTFQKRRLLTNKWSTKTQKFSFSPPTTMWTRRIRYPFSLWPKWWDVLDDVNGRRRRFCFWRKK